MPGCCSGGMRTTGGRSWGWLLVVGGDDLVDLGGGDATDEALDDDAVRRDEEGLRHARHAVGDADAVLRVVDHGPVAAALGEELLRVIGAVVVGDAHHGRVAGFAVDRKSTRLNSSH